MAEIHRFYTKISVSIKMINPVFCGEEKKVQSNSKFTELSAHCHIFQGS
jgi:hypothetical protein